MQWSIMQSTKSYILLLTILLSSCLQEEVNRVYYNKETTTYLYIDDEELSLHPPNEMECSRFMKVANNAYQGRQGLGGKLDTLLVKYNEDKLFLSSLNLSFDPVQKIEYDSITFTGINIHDVFSKNQGNMKRIDVLAHMITNEDYTYRIDENFAEDYFPVQIDIYKNGESIKN